MTIAATTMSARIGRNLDGGDHNAPIAVHTIRVGTARSRTASKSPATIAAAIVASSVASRAVIAIPINASAMRTAATTPRSVRNPTQSLLGQGLIVIPGSEPLTDGSPPRA